MEDQVWLRWYVSAFFVAFAIFMVAARGKFVSLRPYFAQILGRMGPADRERLERALAARLSAGSWPLGLRAVSGAGFLVLGLVTATTRLPIALSFALGIVWLTVSEFASYQHERPVGAGGAAPALEAVPPYIFAVSLIAALTPASFFDAAPATTALVVCLFLVIIGLAVVVARRSPAVRGDDVAVESFIEQRARRVRVINMLMNVSNCATLFITFSLASYSISTARLVAVLVVLACSLVELTAYLIVLRAPSLMTFSALDTARRA